MKKKLRSAIELKVEGHLSLNQRLSRACIVHIMNQQVIAHGHNAFCWINFGLHIFFTIRNWKILHEKERLA